ncbi:MAG: hypothetical protein MJ207_02265 [Bacilli bacterium]|nr:hypothetical protein [Bacilli bacterium]
MDYDSFFKLVKIEPDEIESAKVYLDRRGIQEHINVANFLKKKLNRTPTYCEVASTMRYDKRIRRILYKFLGFLEENMRAYISNKYSLEKDLPNGCNKFIGEDARKLSKNSNKTFDLLSYDLFSNLVDVAYHLPDEDFVALFPNVETKANKKALVALRNKVGHNKFLLNQKDLCTTMLEGKMKKGLTSSISNLIIHLPSEFKNEIKKEIDDAFLKHQNNYKYQVFWSLPREIRIIL